MAQRNPPPIPMPQPPPAWNWQGPGDNSNNKGNNDDSNVETILSVRVITAVNTYTGNVVWVTQTQPDQQDAPKSLIAPAVRTDPASTMTGGDPKPSNPPPPPSSSPPRQSATPSRNPYASQSSSLAQSTLQTAPKVSSASASASVSSAVASVSAAAAAGSSEGGMSGGAKAGLALGILLLIGALLMGILFVYRRKKKQMEQSGDNEKFNFNTAPPPQSPQIQASPTFPPTPSIRSQRTMSTAPRLSLRPVTQFDPAFEDKAEPNNKNAGGLLSPGTAAAAAAAAAVAVASSPSPDKDLPHRPTSSSEHTVVGDAAPGENPFKDPESTGTSHANPFSNDAALDASQVKIPDTPPDASPLQPDETPSSAPIVQVTSAAAPVVKPASLGAVSSSASEFPAPPSSKTSSEIVPPSPAWTDDLPASPGPAPAGPPPVAGAIAAVGPRGPPAGPNNVHRVQLDFKPTMQDELELRAGQLIRMLHEYDDGWALCVRMDRSQQGVVPRTCLSKHPVKPRNGPPRQGQAHPGMRGPAARLPKGPTGIPAPPPLSPASGQSSPQLAGRVTGSGRASPSARTMSPPMQGVPRAGPNSNAPQQSAPRARSNSNAPYAGVPRSMSPGPYGGGPELAPPPQLTGRPRSNSAGQVGKPRQGPGPSPMNPNAAPTPLPTAMPARKPVPGAAIPGTAV